MTRLIDRWLARSNPPGYNEQMFTGAEYATGLDTQGSGREGASQGLVRMGRRVYAENGIVFACEAIKMALFSEARFKFQRMTDDSIFGDQSLGILEHPWPNASQGELLARACQDGTMGNGYYRKAVPDDGGDPVIVQLPQEKVTIISEEKSDSLGRTWKQPVAYAEEQGPGKDPQIYTVDEVGHFSPVPDPSARWRGMSWLTPTLREVAADTQLTRYKEFHLERGAMPGLVVKYSVKLSNTTIDKLRKRFQARYGGPENAGNVLVLDEGADMTVAGSTLEQLQYDAVTKAGERRICADAGPGLLTILGFQQGSYMDAIRELADLWARPHWRILCASLEHLVPTSANVGPVRLWYDVSGIAALREGELQRAQAFLVTMQGIASAVAAGYKRDSAVQAAGAGDVSLLQADPSAPPAGVSGRETATENMGGGGRQQPPTGGPNGGPVKGRPPQAGRPQQLPGVGKPNLPNALPRGFGATPALPGGARGSRSEELVPQPVANGNGHAVRAATMSQPVTFDDSAEEPVHVQDEDAERIIGYLERMRSWDDPLAEPPTSAVHQGWLAADNEHAWLAVRSDPRFRRLGLSVLEARSIAEATDPRRRAALRANWDSRLHPRVPGGPHGGQFTSTPGGLGTHHPAEVAGGHLAATAAGPGKGQNAAQAAAAAQAQAASLGSTEQRFGAPDSLTRYTQPDGTLMPARARLHDRIVTDALAHGTRKDHPVATFLGGGTASGKSTLGGGPVGSVHIDADAIKEQIPEYVQRKRAGDVGAAAYAHEESSMLAKRIMAAAGSNGYDFTLDGTGDNSYGKMKAKLDQARAAGHSVHGKYVTVDTDTAIERAKARAAQTGRMVPESVIRQIHRDVSANFEKLIANDDFDAVELWDTNGPKPELIGVKPEGGKWTVRNERAWQRFLAKAR